MDLLGYCSANVQGDSGDAPLHRPGQTSDTLNFLNGPLGTLMRLGSSGRRSVGKFVVRIHTLAVARNNSAHSLAGLLTFMTSTAAEWYSTATQYWWHRSLRGTGLALPLWAVNTMYSLSEIRTKEVLRGAYLSGNSLFGARETASSAEDKHSHTSATTPEHGVTGERAARSVEEDDQAIVLNPLLQRITRTVLRAWFDRIPHRRHRWDHASGPEAQARILLTLGALETMLGFSGCRRAGKH